MPSTDEEILNAYEQRINRVIDYIREHIDQELSLDVLAKIACFSKFHFHRIFRALVGETINDFTRRLRLEKAAYLLIFDRKKSITEIAFDCGFSSSQNFAKAFKLHFNITPSNLRKNKDFRDFTSLQSKIGNTEHNPGNTLSNQGKDLGKLLAYYRHSKVNLHEQTNQQRRLSMHVEIQEMPSLRVAYVRHIGAYEPEFIGPAFQKLLMWAGPRGLLHDQALVLGVSWDTPHITPEEKCRYDACVTVPERVLPEGNIGVQQLPDGRCAVYQCEVANEQFQEPWTALMRDWLPFSGYQPDDRPTLEIFRNNAAEHPEQKWIVDFCLPVKPL